MSSFVYIIEAQGGFAKIGCARAPDQRLATVRTHSPLPVRLFATWPGVIADEHELHRRFAEQRSHSEWFRIEDDFLIFMAEVRGRGLARIEPWSNVTFAAHSSRVSSRAERRSATMKALWASSEFRCKQAKERYFQNILDPIRDARKVGITVDWTPAYAAAREHVEERFTVCGPHQPSPSYGEILVRTFGTVNVVEAA